MKNTVHITDKNERIIMSNPVFTGCGDNSASREMMKKIAFNAVLNALTDRQRACVVGYYLDGKKGREIARELGINPSTVSRHIANAQKKLRQIASFYSYRC